MDGMSIAIGGETYVPPLASVVESLQADPRHLRPVAGRAACSTMRGEYLPVLDWPRCSRPPTRPAQGLGNGADRRGRRGEDGLVVDELVGQHQVVVKSLGSNYGAPRASRGRPSWATGTSP